MKYGKEFIDGQTDRPKLNSRKCKQKHYRLKKCYISERQQSENCTACPIVPSVTTFIRKGNLISVDICGKTVPTLVDTGVMISCMAQHVYELFGDSVPVSVSQHSHVQGEGGNKIPVQGQSQFQFKIENQTFSHTFHVLETMSHSLILGEDFLQQNQATIDYAKMVLKFPMIRVSFLEQTQPPSKSILVRSSVKFQISSKSECLIQIKMRSLTVQQNGILEPIAALASRQSLIGARCLIDISQTRPNFIGFLTQSVLQSRSTKTNPLLNSSQFKKTTFLKLFCLMTIQR